MSEVAARLESLGGMSLAVLREEWRGHSGCDAPSSISRELLQWAIGFRMQEEVFGGLNRQTLYRLKALQSDIRTGKTRARKTMRRSPALKPGTKLIRGWQGKVHEVLALEDGQFAWAGKTCRSLTVIARHITGAHWSGPRFFGLKTGKGAKDG